LLPNISDVIIINFREGSLLSYSVVVLPRLLLRLSSSSIIGLGIDLDRILRYSVAFDVLLRFISSR
jgi:hypothetical protein